MSVRIDTLEQHDRLGKFFALSATVHIGLFSAIALYASMGGRGLLRWGDPHSIGGDSVGVTAVRQIPLPGRTGAANPLANDTPSQVPLPPKPQAKKQPEIDPDALPLKAHNAPRRPTYMRQQEYSRYRAAPDRPNQLYSSSGQSLQSQMYGSQTGTGGVQMGGAFGDRFGWYRDLIEQRISQRWSANEPEQRFQTATVIIVTFVIQKSGSISDVRVFQSSGNRTLDYAAQRSIFEAGPFPPLPTGYERSSADIEIWFQLKR
jgi:protein TonB